MKLADLGPVLFLLASLGSCTAEDARATQSGGDVLVFDGRLALSPSASSAVVLGWDVIDGDPDYGYLWGRANVRGAAFSLHLKTRPPTEAMNMFGVGVARLLSVSESVPTPEGKLQGEAASSFARGVTGASRLAVLYVDHDMANAALSARGNALTAEEREAFRAHWLFDFPPGYSCAKGRDAGPGEIFDSFVPVDCAQLQVEGTDAPFPNWT